MKSFSSRELRRLIEADGWVAVRQTGSHVHFKRPGKRGVVTIPHPRRDLPLGTVRSIFRQAGLKLPR